MGNLFTNIKVNEEECLQLSNGSTDVFICLLTLSGSAIAKTKLEITTVTCIASSDQNIYGSGCVGFDLVELPWPKIPEEFRSHKEFLLSVIDRVLRQKDWHNLDYSPDVNLVIQNQNNFMEMVKNFEISCVEEFEPENFNLPKNIGEKCTKHGVYLHHNGCVVCNDNS